MGGRPSKPAQLLKIEGKSHKTKAELEVREKAEAQLLTGIKMKAWPEVRESELAKKEFNRVTKLLEIINYNDALHEAVINRYCMLTAECKQILETINQLRGELVELTESHNKKDIEVMAYLQEKGNIHDRMIAWDKKLMDKRKMLLAIERENIMTILAALRAIPKQPPQDDESPMAKYLREKREKQSG